MDAAKRRAMIKAQAAKKVKDGSQAPKGMGPNNPSTKRTIPPKQDHLPEKPKITSDTVVGLEAEGAKTVVPAKHGAGKGLMKGPPPFQKKPLVLFHEDPKYALKTLTSIMTTEDYEDLGNHSTEAMVETGLVSITQAMVMMKGLMGRCLHHETALEHVRAKADLTEDELSKLKTWKSNMEKKFDLSERIRKELEQGMEEGKKVLEDRDKEIQDLKDQLRQAKEVVIREYRDSDALLSELGDTFLEGFDDALCQVKKAYPDLDVSNIKVEDQGQTSVMPVASENTEDLFAEDATQGDGELAQAQNAQGQVQPVVDDTRQLEQGKDANLQVIFSMAAMNTERALSSSSSTSHFTYEVFLSFRGEDTRSGFTSHLYTALDQKGICTFIDDEKLERGKSISPTLMKAIKESRFAIVILSKNYASSTWCLEELEEIIGCITKTGMIVLPIFYNVDPSDVRKQIGPFKQAFDEHEQRFKENTEKVQKWRAILKEVANTSGWHLQKRSEAECIQDIVEVISNKFDNTFSAHDISKLIGMESRVEKLKSYLAMESNDVHIIGIWGTGGMGKTTLARVVYSMVSNHFEACCFIANVREESKKCGLCKLQKKLLKKLLMLKNLNLHDVNDGVQMIKNRLHNKKILLVLDDINELDQLKKLAGEHCWFGSGSRIMITTRDRHLLVQQEVTEIYEVEELNHDEALKLFSLKAFKMDHPTKAYGELSQAFVDYCKGLPLALEVLGSFLFQKSTDEWKSELDRLMIEFCDRGILNVLQISFYGLQPKEKNIFLNIACFFNHKNQDDVIKILDCLELHAIIGLRVLIDKSLIKLHENQLWMHDLLQDMGRHIVCQECQDPAERSRLWSFKDIDKVLRENTGTRYIQYIELEMREPENVDWNPKAFSKMRNLEFLKIHGVQLMRDLIDLPTNLRILEWRGYPSESLTSSSQSKIFDKLKFIELSESQKLNQTPNINEVPNLESLVLEDCINLRSIDQSIGTHKKLTILNLLGCKNLTSLPTKFETESLTELNLCWCSKITKIPEFGSNMKRVSILYLNGTAITTLPTSIEHLIALRELHLRSTAITSLPTSIEHLTDLVELDLNNCKNLVRLPNTLFNSKLVREINLGECSKVDRLPKNLGNAESLKRLDLSETAIRTVPSSIGLLKHLVELTMRGCRGLSMPISNDIGSLFSLESLDLSGNDFVCLPESIIRLSNLKSMYLNNCTSLQSLPKLPLNIAKVEAKGCISLTMIPDPLKPSDSLEPSLCLQNCLKLTGNQSCIDWFISGIRKSRKLSPSLPPSYHNGYNVLGSYSIVIPGSEIPKWFDRQSMGDEVEIKLPSHLYKKVGIAICFAFRTLLDSGSSFLCLLTANGKRISIGQHSVSDIGSSSDHLCLVYLTPQFFYKGPHKLLWEGDVNGFSKIRIKIEAGDFALKAKKWGFGMICKKDNNSITPNDGMDVLHHNLDNSSVEVEYHKVKHSHDDYNGAGPSGEGSSNDIPNPKGIKRHTETHGNSDSVDCDEELNDRDKSNDDMDEDDLEEDNDDSDESSVDRGKYSESDLDE